MAYNCAETHIVYLEPVPFVDLCAESWPNGFILYVPKGSCAASVSLLMIP